VEGENLSNPWLVTLALKSLPARHWLHPHPPRKRFQDGVFEKDAAMGALALRLQNPFALWFAGFSRAVRPQAGHQQEAQCQIWTLC
jgi:hypothetical protein